MHLFACLCISSTFACTCANASTHLQIHCHVCCLFRVFISSCPYMWHSWPEPRIRKSDCHLASIYLRPAPFMNRVTAYCLTAGAATCHLCLDSNSTRQKKVLADRMCMSGSPRAPFIQCWDGWVAHTKKSTLNVGGRGGVLVGVGHGVFKMLLREIDTFFCRGVLP